MRGEGGIREANSQPCMTYTAIRSRCHESDAMTFSNSDPGSTGAYVNPDNLYDALG